MTNAKQPHPRWKKELEKVRHFAERSSRLPEPYGENDQEKKLYRWVSRQRNLRHSLSNEQRKELESIDCWTWQKFSHWDNRFEQLRSFVDKHGRLPKMNAKSNHESMLGRWVNTQRGDKTTPERRAKLETIPGWVWNPLENIWDSHFEEAKAFVEQRGKYPDIQSKTKKEQQLARWMYTQRRNHKLKKLEKDRVAKLETIPGWSWSKTKSWEERCRQVKHFVESKERYPSVTAKSKEEKSLARWIHAQRFAYRRGDIPPEQSCQLEEVSGWYWSIDEIWLQRFEEYVAFCDAHNSKPANTTTDPEEKSLAAWASTQRYKYNRNALDQERVEILNSCDRWSWGAASDWEDNYWELLRHVRQNDNSINLKATSKLGKWVRKQRKKKAEGKLSLLHIALMEKIPGWEWQPSTKKETVSA